MREGRRKRRGWRGGGGGERNRRVETWGGGRPGRQMSDNGTTDARNERRGREGVLLYYCRLRIHPKDTCIILSLRLLFYFH